MPSVDTASAILRALSALGVTHVLYCPGSRSAPFAYALESGAFGGQARPVLFRFTHLTRPTMTHY